MLKLYLPPPLPPPKKKTRGKIYWLAIARTFSMYRTLHSGEVIGGIEKAVAEVELINRRSFTSFYVTTRIS